METLDSLSDEEPLDLNLNTNNKEEETKFNSKIFTSNNFRISLVLRDSTGIGSEPGILSPPLQNDASSENSLIFFDIKQITDKKNDAEIWDLIKSWLEIRQSFIGNDITIQNDVNYGEGSSSSQAKKTESIATLHKFHYKHQKLNHSQVQIFLKEIDKKNFSISNIASMFNVSPATLYNIKNQRNYFLNGRSRRKFNRINNEDLQLIWGLITNFTKEKKIPYTIGNAQEYVKENSNFSIPYYKIRRVMKDWLNMTYKRVNPRPRQFENTITFLSRTLFWLKFIQLLSDFTLIVNIDECNIGRSCRTNYSWSEKGENLEWFNTNIVGSVSLIFGSCSNQWWFWSLIDWTINSK